jgi:hypothetical protein
MQRGFEFDRILRAALPMRRQPRGSLYIFSEGKSRSRGHFQTSAAAGVLPQEAAWEAVCSHTRQRGRSVADRGKLPATAARGFAASCAVKGDCAEVMIRSPHK